MLFDNDGETVCLQPSYFAGERLEQRKKKKNGEGGKQVKGNNFLSLKQTMLLLESRRAFHGLKV